MKIASLVFLLLMISGFNAFCRQLRPVYNWNRIELAIKEKNQLKDLKEVLKQDAESVK